MPDITTQDPNEYTSETKFVRLLRKSHGMSEAQARKVLDNPTDVLPTLFTVPGKPLRYYATADVTAWINNLSPL